MRFGTALEAEAAFVRDGRRGLLDDEAFVRRSGKHPSSARVFDDMRVVGPGIVGEHRQFEPILALGFCVTRSGEPNFFLFARRAFATFLSKTMLKSFPNVGLFASIERILIRSPLGL